MHFPGAYTLFRKAARPEPPPPNKKLSGPARREQAPTGEKPPRRMRAGAFCPSHPPEKEFIRHRPRGITVEGLIVLFGVTISHVAMRPEILGQGGYEGRMVCG